MHEKGTQVEEKELLVVRSRLDNLRILSRHFKLVSFDTLEDLYDKCHQDLEWTTNLLLDSGERFFRDDDDDGEREEEGAGGEDEQDSLHGARLCPDVLEEPTVIEVTQQSTSETAESDQSSNNTDVISIAAVPVRNKDHPDAASHLKTDLGHAGNEGERCGDAEAEPEGAGSSDDGVIIEESRFEIEEEMASMDEVYRLLQEEMDEIDREQKLKKKMKEERRTEKRRQEERRRRHLDIQSVELKLPTEVALQLTELFGPVGVDPGNSHRCHTEK